jgi:hypothetical protein
MEHDNYVGARGQRLPVAGLLIAAVTVIAVVLKNLQPQPSREIYGAIGASIVHQNADVQ